MLRYGVWVLLFITPAQAADPLVELNAASRAAYRSRQVELLAKSGPIVVASGDQLVLIHDGKRDEVEVIPKVYHERKAIAHVPLSLWVLLESADVRMLDDVRKMHLESLCERIAEARKYVNKQELTADVKARQLRILDAGKSIAEKSLKDGKITRQELDQFITKVRADVMENAREAGIAQLDSLHSQMRKWQAMLAPEDWKQLRVVIIGAQMPRQRNLTTQYFARLLGEKGEGKRIIYAESLWEEPKALMLLATHDVDRGIAIGFFAKEDRMEMDLLADIATEHISRMKWDK